MQVDNNDAYKYVHSSIRDVLTMEPLPISADFLNANSLKDTDLIFVNTENYTIKWTCVEEYIRWKGNMTKDFENEERFHMSDLVNLASECEQAIFRERKSTSLHLPSPIKGLLNMIMTVEEYEDINGDTEDSHFLIATLIALNMVENSIRHLTCKEHGRAPLLKDMIEIILGQDEGQCSILSDSNVAALILKSLLLPEDGLNLRNLLWHGFLPGIRRKWFALAVVLTISINDLARTSSFDSYLQLDEKFETIEALRKHKSLADIVDHGQGILSSCENVNALEEKLMKSSFLPKSHAVLCRVALKYVHYPVIFASVMGPLLEHALRIYWCIDNQQNKSRAVPGSYYVTLDGHGQRDKHDIVLMPFLSHNDQNDKNENDAFTSRGVKNQMVYRFGSPMMALLVDIFASPPGGPNIRASVAHGLFNKHLFEELNAIRGEINGSTVNVDSHLLRDMTSVLLSILDLFSDDFTDYACAEDGRGDLSNCRIALNSYRPRFSYSALLCIEIDNLVDSIKPFYALVDDGHHREYFINTSIPLENMYIASRMTKISQHFGTMLEMQTSIRKRFGFDESQWTPENYFRESINCLVASECGAARLLLSEISIAASSFLEQLINDIVELEHDDCKLSSRRRKQIVRMCSMARLTLDFYSFAAYCALLYIERRQNSKVNCPLPSVYNHDDLSDDVLFLAVKRSRMVVSTFSTTKTLDRAIKALEQYAAGKAVKAICAGLEDSIVK